MPAVSETRSELATLIPHGYLATRHWLLARGVSNHGLDNLIKSGQLVAPVSGVYRRSETELSWQGVVCSLQRMGSDLVVGGMTALEQQGMAHYLPLFGSDRVHLYGYDALPAWVNRLGLTETFVHHGLARLMTPAAEDQAFTVELPYGVDRHFRASAPERAILEVLEAVPQLVSFAHAEELMMGFANLSPRRLDAILRQTRSVKVKRLFLFLSERQGHSWFNRLNPQDYDLGSGKRVLAKGGILNKTYQITVPEPMRG